MFECCLLILLCHLHPELHIILSLVGEERLCQDSIEYDFAFNIQKGREDGRSLFTPVSLEHIDVLGHQTLQKGLRISTTYRNNFSALQFGNPTPRPIQ